MAKRKSLDFLPQIFQTQANRKFLNASVDQLIQEPSLKQVYGYIGQQDHSPTYKPGDYYVNESDDYSQAYQLEPGLVIEEKNRGGDVHSKTNAYNYVDMLNQISTDGGLVNDHSRLFGTEFYNYTGFVDLDKLVNYRQYYWVPKGPKSVVITTKTGDSAVDLNDLYVQRISDDSSDTSLAQPTTRPGYSFDRVNGINPILYLVRGVQYSFHINQPGHKFYIQTEPGDGTSRLQRNINTRDLLGIRNNGADAGVVNFAVPLKTAQDAYYNLVEESVVVHTVTDLNYNQIYGQMYDVFVQQHSLDGITGFKSVVKHIMFTSKTGWPASITAEQRTGIWQLRVNAVGFIDLTYIQDFPRNHKVFVQEGERYGHLYVYRNSLNQIAPLPTLTAVIDRLYYTDSVNGFVGEIHLLDPTADAVLDVNDILGRTEYTSPNGIQFSSGLKVKFDGNVTPQQYQNNEYIVEQVGRGIQLTAWNQLITPELYNNYLGGEFSSDGYDTSGFDSNQNNPQIKDYIVSNRASRDRNAWARGNRWFHKNVLEYTSEINGIELVLDENFRARRPIIEFNPNLKLYNYGTNYLGSVSFVDTTTPDSLNQILGQNNLALHREFVTKNITSDTAAAVTILPLNSLTRIKVGQSVSGDGIAAGTLVKSISTKNSTVELDKAIVAAIGGGSTLFFGTYLTDGALLLSGNTIVFTADTDMETRRTVYRVDNVVAQSYRNANVLIEQFSAVGTLSLVVQNFDHVAVGYALVGASIAPGTTVRAVDVNTLTVYISHPLTKDVPAGSFITFDNTSTQIVLTPIGRAEENDIIVSTGGMTNQGRVFYFADGNWVSAQQKIGRPQAPLYYLEDLEGFALDDKTRYPSSNFAGSRLFGYAESEVFDKELGTGILYQNIGAIGDIVFDNYYEHSTFDYSSDNLNRNPTHSSGYAIYDDGTNHRKLTNGWVRVPEKTTQNIQFITIADPVNRNNFEYDIDVTTSNRIDRIDIRVNGKKLTSNEYTIIRAGKKSQIKLAVDLVAGDRLAVSMPGTNSLYTNVYSIPLNLTNNSDNLAFETLTLGEMRNHVIALADHSLDFAGEPAGANNLRDINLIDSYGKLLQHAAGMSTHAKLSVNPNTNLPTAIRYNMWAYGQFKLKLLDRISNAEFSNKSNPRACLDQILDDINSVAAESTAFYYSDMMPSGIRYMLSSNPVVNLNYRQFNLSRDYDNKDNDYHSVLVYLNNQQLCKGKDYTISGYILSLNDAVVLSRADMIDIYEYADTLGSVIPATPTKLGLWPAYEPAIETDNTYRTEINIIQGHDGSCSPCWGDYRDQILLEYELRVYNNILNPFLDDRLTGIESVMPGAFRKTAYSIEEWTQLLAPSYLDWCGQFNIDAFTNTNSLTDPFSYNLSQAKDRLFGQTVPGYWRGVYFYFYDTDQPHTKPWEMLGFSVRPQWWVKRYGPAPYSSQNIVLWRDLEMGVIYNNGKPYIDTRFARPGLKDIIPVDASGELLPPEISVIGSWKGINQNLSWRVGDQSPQETAWRRSSGYPFAVQLAWALARPAEYSQLAFNTRDVKRIDNLDQIVDVRTNSRRFTAALTSDAGYIPGTNVWIRDQLLSRNLNLDTNWRDFVQHSYLNLVYKLAGYSDIPHLQIIGDQVSPNTTTSNIVIPTENYDLMFTKSAPISRVVYSAVIVQKVKEGYRIFGFDTTRPYFLVYTSRQNNNSFAISVAKESAVIYNDGQDYVTTFPYGTVFVNRQQVIDFLISYGRWLTAQGFAFDDVLGDYSTTQDWILSAKEFLFWNQQNWGLGTTISLTPMGSTVKFTSPYGAIDTISNRSDYTRVMDSSGRTLKGTDYAVYREGNSFELILKNSNNGIHLIDVAVVQYEHTLVLDNKTVFNDQIYDPVLGNRQYRLRVQGYKTQDWDGSLYAPGFLVNTKAIEPWQAYTDYYRGDIVTHKNHYYTANQFTPGTARFHTNNWYEISGDHVHNKLIPSPTFNAAQFKGFYDVDSQDLNVTADALARHSTGFGPRNYFNSLGLTTISQHKFYLGMLKQKGTEAVLRAFQRARLHDQQNEIAVNELFAIKMHSFGNLGQEQLYEIDLGQSFSVNNQYPIQFLRPGETVGNATNDVAAKDLIQIPINYQADIFANDIVQKTIIPTAGPVRSDEINATVFNIQKIYEIDSLNRVLGEGSRIWVASDLSGQWAVMRVTLTDRIYVVQASQTAPNELTFTTSVPHGFAVLDTVMLHTALIKANTGNSSNTIDLGGFYKVSRVENLSFSVRVKSKANVGTIALNNLVYKLVNVRFESREKFAQFTPARGWKTGDTVYIDTKEVLQNVDVWQLSDARSPAFVNNADQFGKQAVVGVQQNFAIVSSPNKNTTGQLYLYSKNSVDQWHEAIKLDPPNNLVRQFGSALNINNRNGIAISAPSSYGKGLVFVAQVTNENLLFTQALQYDFVEDSNFGSSVAMSANGDWLYVGDDTNNRIFVYYYKTVREEITQLIGDGIVTSFVYPSTAQGLNLGANDFSIFVDNKIQVPNQDYIRLTTTDVFNFTVAPPAGKRVEIRYTSYYKLQSVFETDNPDAVLWANQLTTSGDGRTVVVGDPNGIVSVLERQQFQFISSAAQTKFVLPYGIGSNYTDTLSTTETYWSDAQVYIDKTPVTAFVIEDQTGIPTLVLDVPVTEGKIVKVIGFNLIELETLAAPVYQPTSQFGSQVQINVEATDIFVSAPGYNVTNRQNGAVLRYKNSILATSVALGTTRNPSVVAGSKMYINDFNVTFRAGTTANIVSSINAANIPGISASLVAGCLQIQLDTSITDQKLTLRDDTAGIVDYMGFVNYEYVELITSPTNQDTEEFGENIALDPAGEVLLVGATLSDNQIITSFDGGITTWDNRTLIELKDTVYRSGSAHVYEYQAGTTGKFVHATTLTNSSISSLSKFGTAVALSAQWMFITAPNGYVNNRDQGVVYIYNNSTGDRVWQVKRSAPANYNSSVIKSAFLYDRRKRIKIANLTVLDPVHGIFAPRAMENIDYTINYDPAVYNNAPSAAGFNTDMRNVWGEQQVGKIWWDTNSIKLYDNNQGNLLYRLNNWSMGFANSTVAVYQWMESNYVPNEWYKHNPDQPPLYQLQNVYSSLTKVDNETNQTVTRYYFWVRNGSINNRNTREIENAIATVRQQSEPYLAVLDTNAVGIYNAEKIITSDISLIFTTRSNEQTKTHDEWHLITDNTDIGAPMEFYTVLKNSLVGQDSSGRQVPDLRLPTKQRYGTDINRRQSLFVKLSEARKLFVNELNNIAAVIPLALMRSTAIDALKVKATPPAATEYLLAVDNLDQLGWLNLDAYRAGDRVFVVSDRDNQNRWSLKQLHGDRLVNKFWQTIRAETYNLEKYWSYADWYSASYNSKVTSTYTIDSEKDLTSLVLNINDTVWIKNSVDGGWKQVAVKSSGLELVAQQSATIQFSAALHDIDQLGFGYSTRGLDTVTYSQDANIEFGLLFDVVVDKLLTDEYRSKLRGLIKTLIRYCMEQPIDADWIMKTSLVDIDHRVRGLDQIPVYLPDISQSVSDFFLEAKPFHTVLKEYKARYDNGNAPEPATFAVTDFDLQPYYNLVNKQYHSPQLGDQQDVTPLTLPVYQPWVKNHTYGVVDTNIIQPGIGYRPDGIAVVITGDGTGAKAHAVVTDGSVTDIIIDAAGSGYTTAEILILGANTILAIAKPILGSAKPRTFNTTIKFDRYRYHNIIQDWKPNTQYTVDTVVVWSDPVYRVTTAHTSGNKIDLLKFKQLIIKPWQRNTSYNLDDIVLYRYKSKNSSAVVYPYVVTADFTTGRKLSVTNLRTFRGEWLDNAADRIWAYYASAPGTAGRELAQLMRGVGYEQVQVLGPDFDQRAGFDVPSFSEIEFDPNPYDADGVEIIRGPQAIDTVYYSLFTDQKLGLRPQDINTDGGKFVDIYSTHAPEELVPGRVFDTLDIRVKTLAAATNYPYVNPDNRMMGWVSDGTTTVYDYSGLVTGVNVDVNNTELIVVTSDLEGTLTPDIDYTLNLFNHSITLTKPIYAGYSLFATILGSTGYKETVNQNYMGDGYNKRFLLPDVGFTDIKQIYIKIDGVLSNFNTYETSTNPIGIIVVLNTAPAKGSYVHIRGYNYDVGTRAFARITQETIASTPGLADYSVTNSVGVSEPYAAYSIIRVGQYYPTPAQQTYYTADGININYPLNSYKMDVVSSIADGNITVTVDNVLQQLGVEYNVIRSGTDYPVVQFLTPPNANSYIIISENSSAEYTLTNGNNLKFNDPTLFVNSNNISVISINNHNMIDFKTVVYRAKYFTGSNTVDEGFDGQDVGLDTTGFDNNIFNMKIDIPFPLPEPVTNPADLWVTVNGDLRLPYIHYRLVNNTHIIFDQAMADSDVIVLRVFARRAVNKAIEFRLFKDLQDSWEHLRINPKRTTRLTEDLYMTDRWIYVENIENLYDPDPSANNPGVIFVNGERIIYGVKDNHNSRVGNLRRGTAGTGTPELHKKGSVITEANAIERIPSGDNSSISVDHASNFSTRIGTVLVPANSKLIQNRIWQGYTETLSESETIQARFLKGY